MQEMPDALFSYGTLEFDEVFRAVTGRSSTGQPALLEGYARYRVRGQVYPGIVEESGAVLRGTLHAGLDGDCVRRVDRFEGPLYERRELEVRTLEGCRLRAWTYVVVRSELAHLSDEPWDADHFARQHLAGFLGRG